MDEPIQYPNTIFLGVMLGLVTALCWGVSNFFSKRMIDQIGLARTLFFSFLVGSLFLSFFFFLTDQGPIEWSMPVLFMTLLAASFNLLGFLSIYYGFKIGSLSVVATVSSGWAVVTVVLSLIFLQEVPYPWQQVGIVLILVGVMLVAYRSYSSNGPTGGRKAFKNIPVGRKGRGSGIKSFLWREEGISHKETLGVFPAVCSVLFFGSCYFLMSIVTEDMGPVLPILMARILGVIIIGLFLIFRREVFGVLDARLFFLVMIGLLDAGGFVAFNYGINATMVSLVSPSASLLTLVTVFLARIFLGEKLMVNQQVGFWMTLMGIILISITTR